MALSGVGNDLRDAWSKVPSASSSRGPQIPTSGLGGEQSEEGVQGSRGEPRVGIQDQDVVRLGAAQGDVVRGAETEILRVHGQLGLGKLGGDHLRGPVARRVVDDMHPGWHSSGVIAKRGEAAAQEVLATPRDDHDVEPGGSHRALLSASRPARRAKLSASPSVAPASTTAVG